MYTSLCLALRVVVPGRNHSATSGVGHAGRYPRGHTRPAELLHHVPHRQAAEDQALQALQQLRAHVRPPLPLVRALRAAEDIFFVQGWLSLHVLTLAFFRAQREQAGYR